MAFSERAKTIALAIVKIFETSKPFGDYSAVAVLNDGAGISYGTSQFTHKSGSLAAVIRRFVRLGGELPDVVAEAMKDFVNRTKILARSNDKPLKVALSKLGRDPLMQRAQREIAFENYLAKALEACEGSNFTLPLSLAVIYDSINHGSYQKIRDRVQLELPASIKPEQYEKEWITEYVKKRDAWLESSPRLAATDYRTDFFLAQIARDNWQLNLPLNVHGFKLTEEILFPHAIPPDSAAIPATDKPIANLDKGINDSAEHTEEPPPTTNGSTNVKVEITPDGGVKASTSENQAPPAPKERIAVVKAKPVKWTARVWAKITGAVTGNVFFQWVWAQLEKIQGLSVPESIWVIVSITIAVGSLLWIIYEIVDTWRDNKYQEAIDTLLVKENSTADNLAQLIPADEVELYRIRGYKIITRGEAGVPLRSLTEAEQQA